MAKQVISINPELNTLHKEKFLLFCRSLMKSLKTKNIDDKTEYLVKERKKINGIYSGDTYHEYTDLAFMENLIIDLLLQDWMIKVKDDKIHLELEVLDDHSGKLNEEKAKTRRRHLLARDIQLKEPSVADFIKGMEKRRLTPQGWHSIFSLMRDGRELKEKLDDINRLTDDESKYIALQSVIQPYIQIVDAGERCQQTGLYLSDIWRYFRHTWINEYKSLPGRSISILIRDAGAPSHPVIGIAALGSSVAQQTCRDEWIGWDGEKFMEKLKTDPSKKYGKWILKTLEILLSEIYLKDFFRERIISLNDIINPSPEKIKELRELAIKFKNDHISNPSSAKFSVENVSLTWEQRAETNLFKSKRALLLADLLWIKMVLNKYDFRTGSKIELESCINKADFRDSIQRLARKAKSIHVGINMMDIIVCGSIAPYNQLLGGKLICMLLTSPVLVDYYNSKYSEAVSLIASSMSGKAIIRDPHLVFLGTTSLYGVGSSQYNRIRIPAEFIGGKPGLYVEYKELGYSEGYGSFHFSSNTIKLADSVAGRESGRKKVNSIFGEGANPLLRKLKDAMEILKLESNPILNHRNRRVVYGIALAENFKEVLIGIDDRPKYVIPHSKKDYRMKMICNYWIKRWLVNRIKNSDVLGKVNSHSLTYPITHGAKVPMPIEEEEVLLF